MTRANHSRWGFCLFGLTVFCAVTVRADEPSTVEFFEKRIRPVLVDHCYECHSQAAAKNKKLKGGLLLDSREGMRRGGDSGPAVVPAEPDESLLLSALRYEDFEMPPRGALADTVVADIARWIEAGAVDPRDQPPVASSASTSGNLDIEQGRRHWAYQPLRLPSLPVVQDPSWGRNQIDFFVLAGLEERGWMPAADAPPEVLIRRLYYDLIGLPPAPEEIDRFAANPTPQAYAALVDRLLASPRFGERWGRHWLDVARFGESNTLRGTVFPEAWRYRDWVIDSFNRDFPFDRFVLEQVAGDLLPSDNWQQRRRQLTATTLLALGNTNFENQDKNQLRMDVVDEQLETLSRAFLAQTVTCARCHDHKFDPIPTRDYYALAGILRNTKTLEHANVSRWLEVPLPSEPEREKKRKQHEAAVADLQQRIAAVKKQLGPNSAQPAAEKAVARTELPGLVLDDVQAARKGAWTDSDYAPRFVGAGYIHDDHTGQGQKSVTFEVELPNDGDYEVRMSYTTGTNRATNTSVTVEFAAGQSKQSQINQRRKPPIDGMFISLGTFPFRADVPARVVISNEGADGHVIVDAIQFLDPQQTGPSAAKNSELERASTDDEAEKAKRAELQAERKQLEAELAKLKDSAPPQEMVMTVREESEIEDTRLHIRGSVHNLGAPVERGFLQVADYDSPARFTSQESGRRQLGQWLASSDNPLTARVAVNRLWHWLFGAGLVPTTDNFGTVGQPPSHPELLDYLAIQFQRDDWSVKSVVRRMVMSRTYQMSSLPVQPATRRETVANASAEADVENRLLWRMNRKRLEAECIRDAMLAVSGRLSFEMHGPTFPAGRKEDYDYHYSGPRRSVYVPVFRNALPDIFEVFDFANPSMVVGKRSTSTVAPQALFMMNNPFVIDQSRQAAKRLWAEWAEADDATRVDRAYRLTLGRQPTAREKELALQFVAAADENSRDEIWGELFQAIFATIDFRYLD